MTVANSFNPKVFVATIRRALLQSARPAVCDDIRLQSSRNGWTSIEVAPPVFDEVQSTIENDAYSLQDFESHRADYQKPQTLVCIPSARIRDELGLVFLSDGSVCAECHWWTP
jgi:hypothetical protein